jgi:eukaryotic-like serine/threonine-protein kinase
MTKPFLLLAAEAQQTLGSRFTFGANLGSGGQGLVLRARRHRLEDGSSTDDDVALKLHYDPLQDARIEREIEVMTNLRHASLANLLEHGKIAVGGEEVRYIAWEFIDGDSLADLIAQGPVAPKIIAVAGRDISTALWEITREKVVHRDVKPANIMLRRGHHQAVLIDLGCARHLEQSTLSAPGAWVGTPGYLSPEQAYAHHDLTCFSDVFSLGVTLLEAVLGRHPTGRRQDYLLQQPLDPARLAPNAPAGLITLIAKMVQPRTAFRPRPDRLAADFDALVSQLP